MTAPNPKQYQDTNMTTLDDLLDDLRNFVEFCKAQKKLPTDSRNVEQAIAHIEALTKQVAELRGAMIRSGQAAGCFLADDVSTEFLLLVPAEIEAVLAKQEQSDG